MRVCNTDLAKEWGYTMGDSLYKILLVEDEKVIRDAVKAYLEREHYEVVAVGDGQDALDAFEEAETSVMSPFDLVVLDLMLPRVQGEEVCRILRERSNVPIIILTAKSDIEDRVLGLEQGADDYLVKPFSLRELVARVKVLLRRMHPTDDKQAKLLDYGSLIINPDEHVVFANGEQVELTPSEFKLLYLLAQTPGHVFTRMELVEKVLGYSFEGYERTIDSHVKNLRAKIGDDTRSPKWLFTVHGVGYRFLEPNPPENLAQTAV
jgi:DNA-binding response OmpR family regulator